MNFCLLPFAFPDQGGQASAGDVADVGVAGVDGVYYSGSPEPPILPDSGSFVHPAPGWIWIFWILDTDLLDRTQIFRMNTDFFLATRQFESEM